MNTLTKMALCLIGQLKAQPAMGNAASTTYLPAVNTAAGVALMQALAGTVRPAIPVR